MNTSLRQNISSPSPWEEVVGYSRAVKVGNIIEVSGTTATDEKGEVVGKNDVYGQTRFILQKIEKVLGEAGAEMKHVFRTRTYITAIDQWEAFAKAHKEVFANIKPAATLVEVSRLIHPHLLVEIEVSAVITND